MTMTTAKELGRFRRELLEEGFSEEAVLDLVRQAADGLLRLGAGGLVVADEVSA